MFKIYVGNLDYKVKVEQLRELFSVYVPIEDLVIPTDPSTNRAKGFAIVMIRDAELGQAAVKAMQGKRLLGRELVVNEAAKKKKSGEPVLKKADLVRNGPFGPRLNRTGDPRGHAGASAGRTSRNPRRGGGSVRLPANSLSPTIAADPTGTGSVDSASAGPTAGSPPSSSPAQSAHAGTGSSPAGPSGSEAVTTRSTTATTPRSAAKPASAPLPSSIPPVNTPKFPGAALPERPKAKRLATPKRMDAGNAEPGVAPP